MLRLVDEVGDDDLDILVPMGRLQGLEEIRRELVRPDAHFVFASRVGVDSTGGPRGRDACLRGNIPVIQANKPAVAGQKTYCRETKDLLTKDKRLIDTRRKTY